MRPLPASAEMMRAFLARDASYDGVFVAAVSTTGVFCRPSCPARKPLKKHVTFFTTIREALFAGYRACLRCRPMAAPGEKPAWLRTLLAAVERAPDRRIQDRDLRAMGLEPAQVRRFFLKHYGMTFHAYTRGRRLSGALQQLRRGAKLDDVALGTGFESHSGFRDAFVRTFGQAPGQARDGECVIMSWIETPLGPMIAGANDEGICLLEYSDRRMLEAQLKTLRRRFKCPMVPGESPHIARLREELEAYFAGRLREFTVPLVAPGTPFQERVWKKLLEIPYGETWSYEALAKAVHSPGSQRAVGTANGMNRIAIVIPCHRVVNKNGKLGGYGGQLWRKQALLQLERTGQPSLLEIAAPA